MGSWLPSFIQQIIPTAFAQEASFRPGFRRPQASWFQGLAQSADPYQAIITLVNILLGLVGLVAVIMLIYGGVLYLTSAGDEDKAKKGKQAVMYAIIGLLLIGFSVAIVQFVIRVIAKG